MVMFALREKLLVLAATVKFIVVVLVPLDGMPFTQDGTPLLVQPQPAGVVMVNELEPPPAGAL